MEPPPAWKSLLRPIDKTWRTQEEGNTAVNGKYTTRGFHRTYQITATRNGKSETIDYKLAPGTTSAKFFSPQGAPHSCAAGEWQTKESAKHT